MSVENEAIDDGSMEGPENTTVLGGEGQHEAGTSETNEAENKEPKTFTQEEMDQIISDRLARDRRAQARAAEARAQETKLMEQVPDLNIDDYPDVESYAEALAEAKFEALQRGKEAIKHQSELTSSYEEKEIEARGKYADFKQVAYNEDLKISDTMAQAIMAADTGPEVLYHLGKNPAEAARIAALTPTRQAVEIGKLEAKLATGDSTETKTTKAPAPINPVNTRTQGGKVLDTTDPRAAKELSMEEWAAAEDARLKRKARG